MLHFRPPGVAQTCHLEVEAKARRQPGALPCCPDQEAPPEKRAPPPPVRVEEAVGAKAPRADGAEQDAGLQPPPPSPGLGAPQPPVPGRVTPQASSIQDKAHSPSSVRQRSGAQAWHRISAPRELVETRIHRPVPEEQRLGLRRRGRSEDFRGAQQGLGRASPAAVPGAVQVPELRPRLVCCILGLLSPFQLSHRHR